MRSALVVGAGLSGLAAAWRLREAGWHVSVVERAGHPGGLIGTTETPHGRVERAANAFVWTDTTARWFSSLGIEPRFASERSRRRYIYRDQPRRWPLDVAESAALGLRYGAHWITGRSKPREDDTVAKWSDRVLGRAATEWLVGPALQGIYGAPPQALSARAIFSGERRGRSRKMAAPAGGMGRFIDVLTNRLVERGVDFTFARGVDRLDPAVPTVVATDAPTAAGLLAPHAPALAEAISGIDMFTITTITAFYERWTRDLSGFGMLFPRAAGIGALGVLFNADVFDDASSVRSETWLYAGPATAAPIEQLRADRTRVVGHDREAMATHVTTHVPGLPVYGPSVVTVRDALGSLPPWLAVAGNFAGRLGVARLLDGAEAAAARLAWPSRRKAFTTWHS